MLQIYTIIIACSVIITLFIFAFTCTLYIACKCRLICGVSLRRAAIISIQAIITTFAVFRRAWWCAVRLLCGVACQVAFIRTESPPPQTKTLQTKRVLLYMVASCSRDEEGKVTENFVSSFSFRI